MLMVKQEEKHKYSPKVYKVKNRGLQLPIPYLHAPDGKIAKVSSSKNL